jgi:DNA-binding IclR family transcriptional regulator
MRGKSVFRTDCPYCGHKNHFKEIIVKNNLKNAAFKTQEIPEAGYVKTMAKTFRILEIVGQSAEPISISDIATTAGIPRPSVHRFIQTLLILGYLEQSVVDRRVKIGLKLLPLTANVLDNNKLRLAALPYLQKIAEKTNNRVNLGVIVEDRVLYLAGIEKPNLPNIYSYFGKTAPVHCCSLGKAVLAYLSEDEIIEICQKDNLRPMTKNSIIKIDKLFKELEETRNRGYAIDNAEHNINEYCIAATIFGINNKPVGSLGISSSSLEKIKKEVDILKETTEIISHILR